MSRPDFDIVVVGARCAGAALGTFAARAGARVLLLDRDRMPSDQVLSTHQVHPRGMDVLDELGVGDDVRARAPASPRIRLVKGDAAVDLRFTAGRAEFCPRRKRLDGLLQAAAVAAGAELRDRTRVDDVVFEGERAAGVRTQGHDGARTTIRAALVVGADGRHSRVARQVGAQEYLGYDAPRAIYWGYWNAPAAWYGDDYPFDMYLGHGRHIRVIFQTDDDQLLIAGVPPVDEAAAWRREPLAALRASLAANPVTGPLIEGRDPDGKVRGTFRERYFFRRGAGPGWALVGDAGHHKDFVVGDGITEALLQARSLAAAIARQSDPALVQWWRERDLEALPPYYWGQDEGKVAPPGVLEAAVLRRVSRRPALARRMVRVPERQSSPYDALPLPVILAALAGCLLRGQAHALPEFLAQARRVRQYRGEVAARRRLLEDAVAQALPEHARASGW